MAHAGGHNAVDDLQLQVGGNGRRALDTLEPIPGTHLENFNFLVHFEFLLYNSGIAPRGGGRRRPAERESDSCAGTQMVPLAFSSASLSESKPSSLP